MNRTYLVKIAVITGAYYGSAKLGLSLAFETSSVTAIWPPTGISLAALVLWGRSTWPGVALGAFLANADTGVPLITVLGITTGNTLEAVVGAALLNRFGFAPSLERVRDVLALVAFGAVLSTTIAATIGVGSLIIGDEVAADDFGSVWRVWWLGDMGGDLLVAPVLLAIAAYWPFRRLPGRALEAGVLFAALAAVSLVVFQRETNLAYLVFPFLVWAALRFWQVGATSASLLVTSFAVYFTANDEGPFIRPDPDDSLLLAQTYFGITGLTLLLLAAVITERRRFEESLEHVAATLQSSLLPGRLPAIRGLDLAARFRPAGQGYQVGGDFYDVFETQEGWVTVVGDVSGKGPEAAALTGLVRNTLRVAARYEQRPSEVLSVLNEALLEETSADTQCSVAYALFKPRESGFELTFTTGGHPLPLIVRADGKVESVGTHGMLLGVERAPRYVESTLIVGPGDCLLFYTDGVTDAYAPDRALGLSELTALLEGCAGLEADEIAERIYASVVRAGVREPRDDIALLTLCVTREGFSDADRTKRLAPARQDEAADSARWALPTSSSAPMELRHAVTEFAASRGASAPALKSIALCVSEAVTNVVLHAYRGDDEGHGVVEVEARIDADSLCVMVTDHGHGFEPRLDSPGLGLGLPLIAQISLSSEIISADHGGTTVSMRFDLGEQEQQEQR